MATEPPRERTARCGCGELTVLARGEPAEVYLCSCLDCQRQTGSAFSYAALYPVAEVTIAGPQKTWRHQGDSGRGVEIAFCPTCGVGVYSRAQVFPRLVCVAVGCFADPAFAKPTRLYWAARRHHWLTTPEETELIDAQ
jgi:hypothetical protein